MRRNVILFVLLLPCYLIALLFFSTFSFASIKINEIYPAPLSGEKEWVELYNDSNIEIGVSNYYLNDLAQNKIYLEGTILSPYGFVSGNSSNILNNSGDTIYLKNNLNEILDIATYSASFTAEKNYARCPNGWGDWQILTSTTKNSSNIIACPTSTPTPTLTPTLEPTSEFTQTPVQPSPTLSSTPGVESVVPTPKTYDYVYLSEAMVYPDSGNNEWVEIYNANDFNVNLENWYLDDVENAGSTPKKFSLEILPKSYKIIELTSSIFNNDSDQVRLLDSEKKEKDSFEYGKGEKNKTWGRRDLLNNEFCQQEASKGLVNNDCINLITTLAPTTTPTTNKQLLMTNDQLLTSKPTNKIPPQSINNYPLTINHSNINSSPAILGASTKKAIPKQNKNSVNSLSFLSFSYSLLTITSILIKMKL